MFTLPNASKESLLLPHEVTANAQSWVESFNPLVLFSKLVKFLHSVFCASRLSSGQSQQHIGGIWVTVEQIVQVSPPPSSFDLLHFHKKSASKLYYHQILAPSLSGSACTLRNENSLVEV